ncbi:MAG: MarR family winged helix-turn-helix transcriptional regulator [Culicoidibacterales bacterium]
MQTEHQIKLENQLCFSLYATSKEVIKLYKPLLDTHGLTYTQYIALMVIWEHEAISVKALGSKLYLDSGTLTPLLKKLELQGFVTRTRLESDERTVIVAPTLAGWQLQKDILTVPESLYCQLQHTAADLFTLKKQLDLLLETLVK